MDLLQGIAVFLLVATMAIAQTVFLAWFVYRLYRSIKRRR